jgi:RecA-family ATPase
MTVEEQAKKYLEAIPPAISGSGGHSQTLNAARALIKGFSLPFHSAMQLLQEWNHGCQPPWTERELEHKLREAETKPFDKPDGYLLKSWSNRPSREAIRPQPAWRPALPTRDYDLEEAEELQLPQGKRDGFPQLLEACFRPGEGVRVMSGLDDQGLIRCDPKGGVVLSREEWLDKLDQKGGINGIFYRLGGPPVGVYLGCNPMKEDGRGRDTDVTDFRHCLLEFDEISIKEQWLLFVKSNLPCAAVIYSGKKSLHAWVKIDAKDRKEYDERVNLVYNHFQAYKPDPHNKNPSRFSRCPDAKRGDTHQMLLALDIGCSSFTEWSKHLLVQGIGTTFTSDDILDYSAADDNLTIVGNNYLRKGGSCLLVGPSGIGKSSLGFQIGMCWAMGRPCFGISPARELKVLLIQAENDIADMHDMMAGIAKMMQILGDIDGRRLLRSNLIINHNVSDTGHDFILSMQRLVDHHVPDLVIVDPLLSFIGADISKQEVVGQFCRNWLNPVLKACNVAFLAIHHTGKPPAKDGKNKKAAPKSLSEWAYHGIGSSELTNWARAIIVLNPVDGPRYDLLLAKRGQRAGATHPNGTETKILHLEHSREDIFWLQTDPPPEVASATQTEPDANKPLKPSEAAQVVAGKDIHKLLATMPEVGWEYGVLFDKLREFAANELGILLPLDKDSRKSYATRQAIDRLVASHKLGVRGKMFVKGSNA